MLRPVRWLVFLVIAGGFFAVALSNDAYNLTSPPGLTYHVLLRKCYSIGAVALVGAPLLWEWRPRRHEVIRPAAAVEIYSARIEAGLKVTDGHEPLLWNAVDVACGALGGGLAATVTPWRRVK